MTYRHGNSMRQHEDFLRAQRRHDNASPPDDPMWDDPALDEYDAMLIVAFLVTYLAALSAAERADGRAH